MHHMCTCILSHNTVVRLLTYLHITRLLVTNYVISTRDVIRSLLTEYGDWDEDEIECLKEGLRKFGRAWGEIYREVGGRKTATQCKQFYDTHCAIDKLGLLQALADHSSMKVCTMNYSAQHCTVYGIAICVYASRKFWRILICRL